MAVPPAIAGALSSPVSSVRIAAFEALARRAAVQPISSAFVLATTDALGDPEPLIRALAARTLCAASPSAAERLARHLDDPDATMRTEALKAAGKDASQYRLACLSDPASIVRHIAMQLVLERGSEEELAQALEICTTEGIVDSIRKACALSDRAGELVLSWLSTGNLSIRQARAILDAIAEAA